jgi:hypothetical protein
LEVYATRALPLVGKRVPRSFLSDPRLDLFDGEGNLLASNNNWQDSQLADIDATGLAPSDRLDAAILITLPRGAYTAVLSPVEGEDHGTALTELYKLWRITSVVLRRVGVGNVSRRLSWPLLTG